MLINIELQMHCCFQSVENVMPDSLYTPDENFPLGQEESIKMCVLKTNINIMTVCSDEKKN